VQLTLLLISPRVAPGLMTWRAWSTVAAAPRRASSSTDAPLARAVADAGHPVDTWTPPVTAADLLAAARDEDLVWLADEEEAQRLPAQVAAAMTSGAQRDVEVQALHASYDVPGARLLDLVRVMDRLRNECPWDREQTHRSLARHLLEETYETLEAIESEDYAHLREELGDLLLQVYFHARVAAEAGERGFTIDDVAGGIVDKLVHRHPHVFARAADADPVTRTDVESSWEALKAQEKGRGSVLDGVPMALPALALADKVLGRAAKVDVTHAPSTDASCAEAWGDRLLSLVVDARAAGVDPEQALRGAVHRLAAAVRVQEQG
jgi:XTP/dITP diphosphohydrolase